MDDPRDRRIAELEAENAELRKRIAQLEHQVQTFLQRRKRRTSDRKPRQGTPDDRRRQEHRKHPGVFRPEPSANTQFIEHDVHPQQCSHCGSCDLEATGKFDDHFVADIPEPKLEWHRYRRHIHRCRHCERTSQGRGDLELPGAHIGPRARLLTCYGRAHLGISLGKTRDLLHDFFGLTHV
jgi:zinc-finger binding domain of transposase IS66